MSVLRPVAGPTEEIVAALREWLGAREEPEPLIVASSGSTGVPKRVVLPRRAVLASVRASSRRLGAQGQWLLALPATYVAGLQVICRSLVAGYDPLVVADSFAATLADPAHLAPVAPGRPPVAPGRPPVVPGRPPDVPGRRVGGAGGAPLFTSLVPTQLHRLLAHPAEIAALRGLHTILLGGGPVDPALRARAAAEGLRVVATYGASETAGGCVYDGVPLDGVAVALADDGRIRIAGPTLFAGYDGDPALTAETLVDGWYLTSDAGRLDEDGRLEVLGRLDDVVLSGGVNVPVQAVAARLRAHPRVDEVEVIGVPDEEWGQRVVAFVVGDVAIGEIRDWVALVHPRAWAPRAVVRLEAMPLLANGKTDRVRLRELA